MSTRRIGGLIGVRLLFLTICLSVLSACSTVSYYEQAVRGHLGLLFKSASIDRLIVTHKVGSKTRERLMLLREIRRFGVSQLSLPDNDSYTRYADIGRNYAVWAVFASDEFSIAPKTWCFPIAGCVPYRGYFSPRLALISSESFSACWLKVHNMSNCAFNCDFE